MRKLHEFFPQGEPIPFDHFTQTLRRETQVDGQTAAGLIEKLTARGAVEIDTDSDGQQWARVQGATVATVKAVSTDHTTTTAPGPSEFQPFTSSDSAYLEWLLHGGPYPDEVPA